MSKLYIIRVGSWTVAIRLRTDEYGCAGVWIGRLVWRNGEEFHAGLAWTGGRLVREWIN